jgi:hypothetical protein
MPRRRRPAPTYLPTLRSAAVVATGVCLSFCADVCVSPSAEPPSVVLGVFPSANARDQDDNRHAAKANEDRDKEKDPDKDVKKDGRDAANERAWERHHQRGDRDKGKRNGGDMPGAGKTSPTVTFEPGKRAPLNLHVPVGRERREPGHPFFNNHHRPAAPHRPHESAAWHFRHAVEHEGGRSVSEAFLKNIRHEGLAPSHPADIIEKAMKPVDTRFRGNTFKPKTQLGDVTVQPRTSFAIEPSAYSHNEVLAVRLDQDSIDRLQSRGFKADAPAGSDEVTRLTLPPGMDALKAKELLSQELPFNELHYNMLYRVFRAAMREEPGKSVKTQPGEKCSGDHCFARDVIGWKDMLSPCARGLRIGVIDTVIDAGHPAFAGRYNIHRNDFIPDKRQAAPDWHGTGVLSILAANPLAGGAPGLVPDAEFFVSGVFFTDDRGEMAADTISLLSALQWMGRNEVKVVNMSFAGPRDELVQQEIDRMASNGVIFVAAAGNEGPAAEPSYPAAYPEVIAVTAVTKDLRNYRYANRGPHIDVSAPGVDIWSAAPGGREGYHSGTSFAAPHVTAVVAVQPRENLQNKQEVLEKMSIEDLSGHGRDPVYGRGLAKAPETCTPPSDAVASAEP